MTFDVMRSANTMVQEDMLVITASKREYRTSGMSTRRSPSAI